jgi:hypothetical protein
VLIVNGKTRLVAVQVAPKKPQGLRDILNAVSNIVNGGKPPKQGGNAMASAQIAQAANIRGKTVKGAAKAGNAVAKGSTAAIKTAFGDPKKGWQDVAINSGAWLIPYGKAFKIVDKTVKGAKYVKGAKAVRGLLKGSTLAGASTALEKTVNKVAPRGKTDMLAKSGLGKKTPPKVKPKGK